MKKLLWLNAATIDATVTEKRPGTFTLSEPDGEGSFAITFVGRSDTDVNEALKHMAETTTRRVFQFSYAASHGEAFEHECLLYHEFAPIDNSGHPLPAHSEDPCCPICGDRNT